MPASRMRRRRKTTLLSAPKEQAVDAVTAPVSGSRYASSGRASVAIGPSVGAEVCVAALAVAPSDGGAEAAGVRLARATAGVEGTDGPGVALGENAPDRATAPIATTTSATSAPAMMRRSIARPRAAAERRRGVAPWAHHVHGTDGSVVALQPHGSRLDIGDAVDMSGEVDRCFRRDDLSGFGLCAQPRREVQRSPRKPPSTGIASPESMPMPTPRGSSAWRSGAASRAPHAAPGVRIRTRTAPRRRAAR